MLGGAQSGTGQSLSVNWSLFSAYDDNVTAGQQGAALDPRYMVNGVYGSANGQLVYTNRGEHAFFSATAASNGRYVPDLQEMSAFDGLGSVSFSTEIGRHGHFEGTQDLWYQPYYRLGVLTGIAPSAVTPISEAEGTNQDRVALTSSKSFTSSGRVGFTENFTPRSAVTFDYNYLRSWFSDTDEQFTWQMGHGAFIHNLNRSLALRAGYGYGRGENTLAVDMPVVVNQNIDLGVDFNRRLSFSRRTRVSFSSGVTGIAEQDQKRYLVVADATVSREIGRTWNADFAFHRGVQYIAGFGDPLLSNTEQLRVAGLVNRRTSVGVSAGYSSGTVGIVTHTGAFSTWTAGTEYQFALTRSLSFTTHYGYYRYDFDQGVLLPFGLPARANRQALYVGISGWLPIVR